MGNTPEFKRPEAPAGARSTTSEPEGWNRIRALESLGDFLQYALFQIEEDDLLIEPPPPPPDDVGLPTTREPIALPPEVLFGAGPNAELSALLAEHPEELLKAIDFTTRHTDQDGPRRREPQLQAQGRRRQPGPLT
jgi:hypothetical protein